MRFQTLVWLSTVSSAPWHLGTAIFAERRPLRGDDVRAERWRVGAKDGFRADLAFSVGPASLLPSPTQVNSEHL